MAWGQIDVFSDFQDSVETFALVKVDGTRIPDVEAVFTDGEFIIRDVALSIEEGDSFERTIPSGKMEVYEITFVSFDKGNRDFPPLYTVTTRKRLSRASLPTPPVSSINKYGQLNIATDQSTINAVRNAPVDLKALAELLNTVRSAIPTNVADADKETISYSLETIEEEMNNPKPKKTV